MFIATIQRKASFYDPNITCSHKTTSRRSQPSRGVPTKPVNRFRLTSDPDASASEFRSLVHPYDDLSYKRRHH